jgi:hypothetical protein
MAKPTNGAVPFARSEPRTRTALLLEPIALRHQIAVRGAAGGNVTKRFVVVTGGDAAARGHQSNRRTERIRQEGRDVARAVRSGEVFINAESSQQVGIDARTAPAGEFLDRIKSILEELGGSAADGFARAAAERIINETRRDATADRRQMLVKPLTELGIPVAA